jgi:hypothetical protein
MGSNRAAESQLFPSCAARRLAVTSVAALPVMSAGKKTGKRGNDFSQLSA